MANLEWADFRPRGLYSSSTDIPLTEGDPAFVIPNAISETGLPVGYYKFLVGVEWSQEVDKYMDFSFTLNGTTKTYRAFSTQSGPGINTFNVAPIIPILGGTMVWDVSFEFPTQAGSASGIIMTQIIGWEKWSDFPA
jgi:hypothetical protein